MGMTVAHIHLLQLAPTSSPHSLSSPCTLFVFLICFILSNIASAVPSVPLPDVCVWNIEGCVYVCVCLRFRALSSRIPVCDVFFVIAVYLTGRYVCVYVLALYLSAFAWLGSDGNVAVCARLAIFKFFALGYLDSHFKMNCVTGIVEDIMIHSGPC